MKLPWWTLVAALGLVPGPVPAETIEKRAWLIMGTVLEISASGDSLRFAPAFAAAYQAAATVDSLMSLYKPESELSRINRDGFEQPIAMSPETCEVIETGLRYAALTGGAFDITVKPMMDSWGFYRKTGYVPTQAECQSLALLAGSDKVSIDHDSRTIRLLHSRTALDLGGIAKGYAVDLMVLALQSHGLTAGVVNLGGNLRAFGAPADSPEGWPVAIRDPAFPDSIFAIVSLRDRAMSSSGGYEKFVILDGRTYSHIMDPRAGSPVQGMAGTAVIAADAMTADILSTAFYVMGAAPALALARKLPSVEALIVTGGAPGANPTYSGTGVFASFLPAIVQRGGTSP